MLDYKKVLRISKLLIKEDLKEYIKNLKMMESKNSVVVITADETISPVVSDKISQLFPKKRIIKKIDPSIIAGLRLINDDLIYDFNLKNMLNGAIVNL